MPAADAALSGLASCGAGSVRWGVRLVAGPPRRRLDPTHPRAAGPPALADTPGLLTAVAGRLTGSAAIFDADWDPAAALPGNLAIGEWVLQLRGWL